MTLMAADTGFLGVDWSSIALVCVAGLVVTTVVVCLYSVGLRMLSVRVAAASGDLSVRPRAATALGWLCIALSAAAVLYGVYLVIPVFHQ